MLNFLLLLAIIDSRFYNLDDFYLGMTNLYGGTFYNSSHKLQSKQPGYQKKNVVYHIFTYENHL